MKIAVVGLGKIGLPLAVQYASRGHDVYGIDVDACLVSLVNAGTEPFPGEAELAVKLANVVGEGKLRATTDFSAGIPTADAVVVVVPLIVDDTTWEPDFRIMDSATRSVGEHLTSKTLVCFETTLPVSTTRNRLKPILETVSGLAEGADFHLVFSPERVLTGRVFTDLRRYPKLIGALSPTGAALAKDFYEAVLEFDERPDLARANGVWDLGSAEAAELVKLAETTYRDVNIALANQFALYARKTGIDIYGVIEAANSQPYSHIHRPGIAVGGHCIPVYPRLYLHNDPKATVVRAAREANAAMPKESIAILKELLGRPLAGLKAAVLGAAYRGGVKETAFSGVFGVVAELESQGATVSVHDPLYSDEELKKLGLEPYHLGDPTDVLVIQADHDEYRELTPKDFPTVAAVFDGRGVLTLEAWHSVRMSGIELLSVTS